MWNNDYLDKSMKNKLQDITLECSVKPTVSILSLTEAKNYIKVNHTADDSLITSIIKNSSHMVENVIHKVIHKSSYTQYQQGGINKIKLLKCPVTGTPTVTYYETFDSTGESITATRVVGNTLYSNTSWFSEGREGDGYKIEYDTGLFSSATDDNSMEYTVIKNCMLRLCAFLYENRQTYCVGFNEENWSITYDLNNIPIDIKNMLLPLRQENLGVL